MHYFGLTLEIGLHFTASEHKSMNLGFLINRSFVSIRIIK